MTKQPKPQAQVSRVWALVIFAVLALLLVALDRATKLLAIANLSSGNSVDFIPGLMDFILVYNRGGAFGLFAGAGLIFVGFAALAVLAIVVYLVYHKAHNPLLVVLLSLIASGALGNACDRAISGEVPDFLHILFIEFPVFNLADCYLTVGVVLLIILMIISMFPKHSDTPTDDSNALPSESDVPAGKPDVLKIKSEHAPKTNMLEQGKDRGYIRLNYYHLFWIFVLCSAFGLGIETLYHLIVFGGFESRAGLVWGPFSPIYGIGACLFTICLNRVYDKNAVVIFLVSMVVGMALEFCTSWLMQNLFGVIAWDYSGTFGNIDGRTNFAFGMMWGMLGTIWVRILLPQVLNVIHKIPLKWHITFTVALSVFMAINVIVTLAAVHRYNAREDSIPAVTIVDKLCDEYFDNSFMQIRFENMSVV